MKDKKTHFGYILALYEAVCVIVIPYKYCMIAMYGPWYTVYVNASYVMLNIN